MFDKIISFSLKYRALVIFCYILLFGYGIIRVANMSVDVFPDLNKPTVSLLVEAGGLAPEEVEKLIIIPLENAVNGATGISRMSSTSAIGYGIIKAEFDWGTDIYTARQTVMERINQTQASLPNDTQVIMAPISSIMGEVMMIGLSAEEGKVSPMSLRDYADTVVKKRLLAVPGVANLSIIGGDVKQYHIALDTMQMQLLDISMEDALNAIENAGLNASGGFLQKNYTEELIRAIGRPQTVDDIKNTVVAKDTRKDAPAVTLGQIADISIAPAPNKRGEAGINGNRGILISITKQPSVDTIKLTKVLEKELEIMESALPEGVKLEKDIFRQSRFIQNAVNNISEALRDGAILIAVILFVFLLNFRGTFVVLTVIPSTFVMTAIVFDLFGLNINTMTLGGLAMALGSLIDDAIIDMTNIYKRLKENKHKTNPEPVLTVVFNASREVRNSIVFSTLLIFLIFLPMLALSGIEGKIFTPLALSFILSMVMSTFVALSLTPALSSYLLPKVKSLGRKNDTWVVGILKSIHGKTLGGCFKYIKTTLAVFAVVSFAGVFMFTSFGKEFLPPFNEGSFNITLASSPGTNIEESNRIGLIAERALLDLPEALSTGRKLGRAELDEHALGININEIELRLKDKLIRSKEDIMQDIRQRVNIPGVFINIGQPISHRIDLIISGVQSQVAVKIFGTNETEMNKTAEEVERILRANPLFTDVQRDMQVKIPQLHIKLDRQKAARHGVQAAAAVRAAEVALSGAVVSQMLEDEYLYDVLVKIKGDYTNDIEAIKAIPVDSVLGYKVPLGTIADILPVKAQNEIVRENAARRLVVQANLVGRDSAKSVDKLKAILDKELRLSHGTFVQIDGQYKTQQAASRNILLLSILSFILMFGALYINYKRMSFAVQLMVTIPLSVIGGIIGVWLTSKIISIATIIGFVALVGIAIRNGILLYDLYFAKEQETQKRLNPAELIKLTQDRLEPVLVTMLTSIAGFMPLIIAGNTTGKEILYPVAIVISFGLVVTTVLNLLVTPLIYYKFHPQKD